MTYRLCTLFFLLLTFLSGSLAAFPIYESRPVGKLSICIKGKSPEDLFVVRSKLKTTEGAFFSQADFDMDLKLLAKEFDTIDPFIEVVDETLHITLNLSPKPMIRSIVFQGNEKIPSRTLFSELETPLYSPYDRDSFCKAFNQLKLYYIKQGFFESNLSYTMTRDPEENAIDILICVHEGRSGLVKRIIFKNFTWQEQSELLSKMNTSRYNFFTHFFTGSGTYHKEAVEQDQLQIIHYLQNEGYADAKVTITVTETFEESNRINLIITADKGPRYTISRITIGGNCLFDKATLYKQLTIFKNDPYNPEEVRDSAKAIMDFYGRKGYIDCIVDFTPKLDYSTGTFSIHFEIEEGEKYRVGLIKVFGNWSTETRVIMNETLLVPGEVFNSDRLKLTEFRLHNIGYFKNVNVYAVKSEGQDGLGPLYRDVHIEVEEAQTGSVNAFFGLSTIDNIYGGLTITETNFSYKGLTRFWRDGYKTLRGGGEYASLNVTLGVQNRSFEFSWTKPYIFDSLWSFGYSINHTNNGYVSKDYNIRTTGVTTNASYPYNPFMRSNFYYRIKNTSVQLYGKDEDEATSKEQAKGLAELKEQSKNAGLISAIGQTWTYDATNHPQAPSKGLKSRYEAEFAGVGGDSIFFSLATLNSYYYPMTANSFLRYRLDWLLIVPFAGTTLDTLPLDERLYLGGDNVIRGYRPFRIGPLFKGTDDPKGGLSMQIYSIQYTYRLFSRMNAFLFFDAGALSAKTLEFQTPRASLGFGVDLKVMPNAPPLTIGYGFPVNPKNKTEVERFFISMGGKF